MQFPRSKINKIKIYLGFIHSIIFKILCMLLLIVLLWDLLSLLFCGWAVLKLWRTFFSSSVKSDLRVTKAPRQPASSAVGTFWLSTEGCLCCWTIVFWSSSCVFKSTEKTDKNKWWSKYATKKLTFLSFYIVPYYLIHIYF